MKAKQRKIVEGGLKRSRMKPSALVTLAAISLLTGCATPIDYSPNSAVPIDQAKRSIRRGIEEGYLPVPPRHVEVTSEKIRMESDRNIRLEGGRGRVKDIFFFDGITKVTDTKTIYFKTLEHLRLVESGRYLVRALDASGTIRLNIACASEEFAKELMDSLATMIQLAKKSDPVQ